jgi:putative membrane protein
MNYRGLICRLLLGGAVACLPILLLAQTDQNAGSTSATGQSSAQTGSGMHANHSRMNSDNSGTAAKSSDKMFVREAAQGGLAEVELGKLATEKASSEQVKKFGQRMVDDHSKANDELKQVASAEGIKLPDTLNAKDKMLKERLEKLNGEQFDRVYMENMVKDHKKDVAEFAKEGRDGTDPQVKEFAEKTLPTLKSHLQEAETIAPAARTKTSAANKTNETMAK